MQLKLIDYDSLIITEWQTVSIKKINSMFIMEDKNLLLRLDLWISNAVNRPAACKRVIEYRAIVSVFISRRNSWEAWSLVRDQWSTSMIDDPQLRVFKPTPVISSKRELRPIEWRDLKPRYGNFKPSEATHLEKNYRPAHDDYAQVAGLEIKIIYFYIV